MIKFDDIDNPNNDYIFNKIKVNSRIFYAHRLRRTYRAIMNNDSFCNPQNFINILNNSYTAYKITKLYKNKKALDRNNNIIKVRIKPIPNIFYNEYKQQQTLVLEQLGHFDILDNIVLVKEVCHLIKLTQEGKIDYE
tara:strand:+ start:76 stop:486 length:411 start_codon:yes stop_codon:yes gene_type:complete